MPAVRLAGTVALSWLTRLATGYRDVFDSQCGYTASPRRRCWRWTPHRLYPRYGYPNDLLAGWPRSARASWTSRFGPSTAPAWRSGLRPSRVALPLSRILATRVRAARGCGRGAGPHAIAAQPPCGSAS